MSHNLGVVVVSPSQSRKNTLGEQLQGLGHKVIGVAGDAFGARAVIDGLFPGLVLLDHDPPHLEGPETTRIILRGKRVPILLLHREQDAVTGLVKAAFKAGVIGVTYWDGELSALETGITFTVECFHQRLDMVEMSAAAKMIVEAGRDIVVKRERLDRSQALAHLRRECRRRNLNLVDYAYQVISGGPSLRI